MLKQKWPRKKEWDNPTLTFDTFDTTHDCPDEPRQSAVQRE